MRDFSDRHPAPSSADASHPKKRLGGYLVEAGLLTPAQVDVALNDQKLTGMRFGEILAARGWVKQQTIEYLMHKVVMPEQQPQRPPQGRSMVTPSRSDVPGAAAGRPSMGADAGSTEVARQPVRRDVPIAKPLPSAGQADGDISWVG